ncbi:TPA: KleE stable inheritance protein [Salmonella enterica subsp. enterica serovar 16:l,v:-]|nr:KleE protein [Salmonella enterica]
MNNVIKFPRNNNDGSKQQDKQHQKNTTSAADSTLRNILHGLMGFLYIVLVVLWIPVRFMLIANVLLQFFRMFWNWSHGPFSAAWPFVISFLLLAVCTYIMTTWKPKAY